MLLPAAPRDAHVLGGRAHERSEHQLVAAEEVEPPTAVADRLLDWRFHCWYWGNAIAIDGLMEAHALGASAYRDHVVDTVRRWHRDCLPNFDDVLAPGATIIQLIMDGDLPAAAGSGSGKCSRCHFMPCMLRHAINAHERPRPGASPGVPPRPVHRPRLPSAGDVCTAGPMEGRPTLCG